MITISRKDIYWGYFSQFFSIASGLVTLPFILRYLTTNEIGLNYILLTVGSLVSLLDFGFSPQFSRNITYVFSGVQEVKREGVTERVESQVNYELLAKMIHTAKYVYKRLALTVLILLLTIGTVYIYNITQAFSNVKYSAIIWLFYVLGTYFNIYYSYYSSLLIGKGLIIQSKKAVVLSKATYILLSFVLLYLGLGLLSIVIANLISPFIGRYIAYNSFFTKELLQEINSYTFQVDALREVFNTVWYNSKKLGLVLVGSYAINKFSVFISGLFLPLKVIASYGLMIQLFSLLSTMSTLYFNLHQPRFTSLRVLNDYSSLQKEFSFSIILYYIVYISGAVVLIFFGSDLLQVVGSEVELPTIALMAVYSLVVFLEGNHSSFATFIVTDNRVPFVVPSLVAGVVIVILDYLNLKFTDFSILGLVVIQFLVQLSYANWKWPLVVLKEFKTNFLSFVFIGIKELRLRVIKLVS